MKKSSKGRSGGSKFLLFLQQDNNRRDLWDGSSWWFRVYNLLLWIYGFGSIAAGTMQLSAVVPNTYTRGRVYGVLYSLRYVQPWWFALCFMGFRMVTFLCVTNMLRFRRTTACGGRPIITFVCMGLVFVTWFMELWTCVTLGYYAVNANGYNQADNPANNPRWCCDPRVNRDTNNGCNLFDAICTDGGLNDASKMSRYILFDVILGTTWAFFAVHCFFAWAPIFWFLTGGCYAKPRGKAADDDENLLKERERNLEMIYALEQKKDE